MNTAPEPAPLCPCCEGVGTLSTNPYGIFADDSVRDCDACTGGVLAQVACTTCGHDLDDDAIVSRARCGTLGPAECAECWAERVLGLPRETAPPPPSPATIPAPPSAACLAAAALGRMYACTAVNIVDDLWLATGGAL